MMTTVALWVIAICAALGACLGILNRKAIRDIHVIMNSRLDQLVVIATEKAFLAGGEAAREAMRKSLEEKKRAPSAPRPELQN